MSRERPVVAILGLGLIGTSLGLGLEGRCRRIGADPDPAARRTARRRGAVDAVVSGPEAVPEGAMIFLAASPRTNLEILEILRPGAKGPVVSDVGSIKTEVARRGRRRRGGRFVPGHPLAGSERGGARAARADLFHGAPWILCGGGEASRRAVERWVRMVGARPVRMTPARHDRVVARTSHLPQLLASVVVGGLAPSDGEASGRVLREWGRIASSPPGIWEEILEGNREALLPEIDRLIERLRDLQTRWERDPGAVRRMLKRGRRRADSLS